MGTMTIMTPELRVLIVDDEPLARRGVQQLLERHADVRVVGEAREAQEALRLIGDLRPDVLFLDVQMPGLDGFELLARQGESSVRAVVFLTAYEEFAVRAFEIEAVDYLVKPVSRKRFDAALARVRRRLKEPGGTHPGIVVDTRQGRQVLRLEEIDWIESADYCVAVHTGSRRYVIRESLGSLERRLPGSRFLRVHRSALVNLARVRRFAARPGGGGRLTLDSGASVPVSRRSRAELMAWFRTRPTTAP